MYSFKATAEMASGHMTCAWPYMAPVQLYQHIHPLIQLHLRSFLASIEYKTSQIKAIPTRCNKL